MTVWVIEFVTQIGGNMVGMNEIRGVSASRIKQKYRSVKRQTPQTHMHAQALKTHTRRYVVTYIHWRTQHVLFSVIEVVATVVVAMDVVLDL